MPDKRSQDRQIVNKLSNKAKTMLRNDREEFSHSSFTKLEFEGDLKAPLLHVTEEKDSRHVRFSQHDEVFQIPHISDLSDEEVEDVWMSPDDFKIIRRECQWIIMMIEQQGDSLVNGIELRGLENHMLSQRKHNKQFRELQYETLYKLMEYREETSIDVTETFAKLSQKISARSVARAIQMGLQDETFARAQGIV